MRISDWSSDVCSSDLHDLRAPLRTIEGFSRLLSERYADKVDDTGRDYLARVRKAAGRMDDLIGALLKMSRVSRSPLRSEEHTSELQSLMRISYAVFCLKKKKSQQLVAYRTK